MNKLVAFLALPLIALSSLYAAEKTLFESPQPLAHGGFGAPVVKMTQVDGHTRVLTGLEGAWIVNHGFYLGLAGYGMSKGIATDSIDEAGDQQYMQMGYGGLLTGYTLHSDALVHVGVQQIIGAGGMVLTSSQYGGHESGYDEDEDYHKRNEGRAFFVWEPQVHGELNVTRWMRITLGAGYRLAWLPEEGFGFKDNDLGGITASLAFKFGKF